MCDQNLQRMRQQQEAIHAPQTEEQAVLRQTLTQENRTAAVQEEQTLAQRMAQGLPEAASAAPVPGEPLEVTAEQMEPKTKREKKLYKERMEEEERRREQERIRQEEQRRQEQEQIRREEQRLQEQVRQQRRELILGDDEIRGLLERAIREQNSEKALEAAQDFLRRAAEKLFETDKSLEEDHGGTVDYAGEMMAPFRILIYSQMGDTEYADVLFRETMVHEKRFEELSQERKICSLISLEMDQILKEEFLADPLLARAVGRITDHLDEQNMEQLGKWGDFEQRVAQEVRMPINNGETTANVFRSGSPYQYLTKKEMREAFEAKTDELMREFPMLTRGEVQKQVAMGHWEELKEKAMKITLDNSVVPGVTKEDWAKHGGASFHHTLPAAQAYETASQSNGFLYAGSCGDGLCELRPTLPETVQINGETVPLRRTYTLFIKALMQGILNEDGALREGAEDFSSYISTYFAPSCVYAQEVRKERLRPFLHEVLNDEKEEEQVLNDWFQLCEQSEDGTVFVRHEIMGAFEETVTKLLQASQDGSLEKKCETELKKVVGNEQTEPLTKEQKQQIGRIVSAYADINQAVIEMLRIRKMDPDSPEVPLPNACSAHGLFIQNIRRRLMGEEESPDNKLITYRPGEHVKAHPEVHIRYIIDHFDDLKKAGLTGDNKKEYFEELLPIFNNKEKLESEKDEKKKEEALSLIQNITVYGGENSPSKYPYHVAGNIGRLANGARMTTEGFAAETKQYMVSPFSTSHAVGIYHGGEEEQSTGPQDFVHSGMIHYYNHDNPLPTDAEQEQVKLNLSLRGLR